VPHATRTLGVGGVFRGGVVIEPHGVAVLAYGEAPPDMANRRGTPL
jgi:hypothetical protein